MRKSDTNNQVTYEAYLHRVFLHSRRSHEVEHHMDFREIHSETSSTASTAFGTLNLFLTAFDYTTSSRKSKKGATNEKEKSSKGSILYYSSRSPLGTNS